MDTFCASSKSKVEIVKSIVIFFPSLRCRNLTLLETYTTKTGNDLQLPDFLEVAKEVTSEPDYSMFNLSICHLDDVKDE